jgi:hypothetical protein
VRGREEERRLLGAVCAITTPTAHRTPVGDCCITTLLEKAMKIERFVFLNKTRLFRYPPATATSPRELR